jgi:lipid A 3-O-deacylase
LKGASVRALALLLALLVGPATSARGRVTVYASTDNDYFDFWISPENRTDLNYTHGVELSVRGLALPNFPGSRTLRRLAGSDSARSALAIRQEVYFPSNWHNNVPGDRPFAGWLEASVGFQNETEKRMRRASIHVGSTGAPSLGERTVHWFHQMFGFGFRPWTRQVPAEPGISLELRGAERTLAGTADQGLRLEAGPEWRVRLGTQVIDATGGGRTTFGLHPPRAWRGTDLPATAPASLYGILGGRVTAVARSVFLDGTWFRDSPGADKRILVPELEWGFGAQAWGVAAEWRVMHRGKDFNAQVAPHTYATIALSWVGR